MPNSVLWVCLVAVWLFVLVPMVLKGRPQLRKTTDAAKETRVVHRGGTRARTTSRRSAAAHPHDPSWKPSTTRRTATATAVAEDDTDTDEVADDDSAAGESDETVNVQRATGEHVTPPAADEDIDLDADGEVEDSEAESIDDSDADEDDVITVDGEVVGADLDDEIDESSEADLDVVDAEITTVDDEAAESEPETVEESDVVDEYEDEEYDDSEYETDEYEDDLDDYDDYESDEYESDEYKDDYDESDEYESDEYDEEVEEVEAPAAAAEPNVRRSRRGVYEPDAARTAIRYRERQRVLIGLVVMLLLAIGAGVLAGLPGWIATGVVGLGLIAYLGYLRRVTVTEQRIRMQRAARARRAQRQEAERLRREEAVPEFAAAPPPPRLRRPGGAVVLEIDDEDPVFDHLPPYQSRRIMRETDELRRTAV